MRILFLDVETTGLPLWREPSDHPDQPHIVDLACELWDDETMELIAELECIINPGVPISPEAASIHGITDEIAKEQGRREMGSMLRDWAREDEAAGRPKLGDYMTVIMNTGFRYADRKRSS